MVSILKVLVHLEEDTLPSFNEGILLLAILFYSIPFCILFVICLSSSHFSLLLYVRWMVTIYDQAIGCLINCILQKKSRINHWEVIDDKAFDQVVIRGIMIMIMIMMSPWSLIVFSLKNQQPYFKAYLTNDSQYVLPSVLDFYAFVLI